MDWSPTNAQRFEGDRAEMAIWTPAPGVVVTRAIGHGTAPLVRFYIAAVQRVRAAHRRVLVFHDWSGVTGYDPEARDLFRAFGKTNDDARVLVRYLVSSRILSMAIQTAGLVLSRDFTSTTQRVLFEQWIDRAIDEAR